MGSRYLQQLFEAYGDHKKIAISNLSELAPAHSSAHCIQDHLKDSCLRDRIACKVVDFTVDHQYASRQTSRSNVTSNCSVEGVEVFKPDSSLFGTGAALDAF